jgi:hypothetical protein
VYSGRKSQSDRSLHLLQDGVWRMAYGVWCIVYGVSFAAPLAVWPMAYGVWRIAYGVLCVLYRALYLWFYTVAEGCREAIVRREARERGAEGA